MRPGDDYLSFIGTHRDLNIPPASTIAEDHSLAKPMSRERLVGIYVTNGMSREAD